MERAGKLTPAATVEVAKTASSSPSVIRRLQDQLPDRQLPAVVRAHRQVLQVPKLAMTGRCAGLPGEILDTGRSRSRRSGSGDPVVPAQSSARSQSARDLRKKIAGSRWYLRSTSRTLAKGRQWRGRASRAGV